MSNEIEIENYHKKSDKIEEFFLAALLIILSPLIIDLTALKPLTKAGVDKVVANWLKQNKIDIEELSEEQVQAIKKLVDKIFKEKVVTPEEVNKYTKSNNSLIGSIIDDIKTKFDEFATIEENYPMADEVKEDYIDSIVKQVHNKAKLFSTMSTISTTRAMMFEAAARKGFTEYQWHTQRDNRVRPTHVVMDKKWVKFNEPPKVTGYYHVAQDWNCRCFADRFR